MRYLNRLAIAFLMPLWMIGAAVAQPVTTPPAPPGWPPPGASPGPGGPGPAAAPLTAAALTPSRTGRVQQYLLTPHGEIDGLLLADGTVVKFPPHLGVTLASTARPGDTVSVVGFVGADTGYGRAMKALTITNTGTGQMVVDQPPTSRPLPPHLRGLTQVPLTVSGAVSRVLVTPKGDVDGLVLATGEQVKFKPHRGAWVVSLLGPAGGAIAASGYGIRNAFGTVVDAESITVGNQTISLRGRGR